MSSHSKPSTGPQSRLSPFLLTGTHFSGLEGPTEPPDPTESRVTGQKGESWVQKTLAPAVDDLEGRLTRFRDARELRTDEGEGGVEGVGADGRCLGRRTSKFRDSRSRPRTHGRLVTTRPLTGPLDLPCP